MIFRAFRQRLPNANNKETVWLMTPWCSRSLDCLQAISHSAQNCLPALFKGLLNPYFHHPFSLWKMLHFEKSKMSQPAFTNAVLAACKCVGPEAAQSSQGLWFRVTLLQLGGAL